MSWHQPLFIALFTLCSNAQEYFPPNSLAPTESSHRIKADWYSEQLKAFDENSLWLVSRQTQADETYRVLWLRSFHDPICVKLSITKDGKGMLTAKETNGLGIQTGKLIHRKTRVLLKDDIRRFRVQLDAMAFWAGSRRNTDFGGADGSNWILEGERNGRYQVIDLWSPSVSDPLRVLGLLMVREFGQFKISDAEIY